MLNFDGGVEAVKLILKLQMSSISFQGDTSVVVLVVLCFGVEFLCCLSLMCVFIFLVQFGLLSGRLLGNSCSLALRHIFMV